VKSKFQVFLSVFALSILFFSPAVQAQKLQSLGKVTYATGDPSVYALTAPDNVQGYDVFSVDGILFEFTYLNRNLIIYRNGVATQVLPESVHHYLMVNQLFYAKGKYLMLGREADTLSIFQLNIQSGKLVLKTSIPKFHSWHLVGNYFVGYKATDGLHARQLYGINIDNFRMELLADISTLIPAENGIGNVEYFGDDQHILMTIGHHAYNTCDYTPSHYIMYNIVTKKIENVGRQVAALHVDNYRPAFHDVSTPIQGGVMADRADKQPPVLVDGNLNIRLDTVIFSYYLEPVGSVGEAGWSYEQGKITGLFSRKSGMNVVVRIKTNELPIAHMNVLALKMYYDKPFARKELSGLSPYALASLKNALYARYGLSIKDPYWNIFFADDYRTPKNVSENGKKNIALIEQLSTAK
jgi:hypothetical protein